MDFQALLQKAYEHTYGADAPFLYYWWLGTLGVLFLLFIIWRIRRARRNFRVFRDESGVAETTNSALRDLVRIACDNVETASKPKINFVKKHGRINVQIKAKLYQGQRLGAVRDQMRRRVTQTFQDTHGILVGDVSFTATGFKKGGPGAPTPDPVPATEMTEPEVAEEAKEPEPTPEPKKEEPKPDPKKDEKASPLGFGSDDVSDSEPEEDPKKKKGLFGGFGGKKKADTPAKEPKLEDMESLDDDFPLLPSDFDEGLEKKTDDERAK